MTKKKRDTNTQEAPPVDETPVETIKPVESAARSGAADEFAMKLAGLENQLSEALSKADEYRDGWQRALADFANLKKRTEREQQLVHQNATANILKRYLEIIDDLERALDNRPESLLGASEAARWAEGVDLTYHKFLNFLESEGVTQIVPADLSATWYFDPNVHEAISQEDSPRHESGQIIGVVQQGYRMGERVLRPARVRVAR